MSVFLDYSSCPQMTSTITCTNCGEEKITYFEEKYKNFKIDFICTTCLDTKGAIKYLVKFNNLNEKGREELHVGRSLPHLNFLYFEDTDVKLNVSVTDKIYYATEYKKHFNKKDKDFGNVILSKLHNSKLIKKTRKGPHEGHVICFNEENIELRFIDGDLSRLSLHELLISLQIKEIKIILNSFFDDCLIYFKKRELFYFAKNEVIADVEEELVVSSASESEDATDSSLTKDGTKNRYKIYDIWGNFIKPIQINLAEEFGETGYKTNLFEKGFYLFNMDEKTLNVHLEKFVYPMPNFHDGRGTSMSTFFTSDKKYQMFVTQDAEIEDLFDHINENSYLTKILKIKHFFDPFAGSNNIRRCVKKKLSEAEFVVNDLDVSKNTKYHFDGLFYKSYVHMRKTFPEYDTIFTSPPFEAFSLAIGIGLEYYSNLIYHAPRWWHSGISASKFLKEVAKTCDVFIFICTSRGSNRSRNEFIIIFKTEKKQLPAFPVLIC